MKKYIYLIFSLLLFIPFVVNGETLTYEVCESGCEYTNLNDLNNAIRSISDLSDKDIVVNVNSDMNSSFDIDIGNNNNIINSVTINGNNHDFNNMSFYLHSKQIEIRDCNNLYQTNIYISRNFTVKNSNIRMILYIFADSNSQIKNDEINLADVFNIDENSLNKLKTLGFVGNISIDNINLSKQVLLNLGGTINIRNSQIEKVLNVPELGKVTTNIYNSEFKSLKYVNITSDENEASDEFYQFLSSFDSSILNYDIYDVNSEEWNGQISTNTTVYFDKEAKLKRDDKLNLAEYLDYYTEEKEIEYTIEDESIAKIENKELIGLKEGSTNITVTTDEGHVVYRINLVVEKETIPEKIDKMTIKVPITGSKVKIWVVIVSTLLLTVIGVCSYMLIKNKKVTK